MVAAGERDTTVVGDDLAVVGDMTTKQGNIATFLQRLQAVLARHEGNGVDVESGCDK